jgi:hypothetical protein
LSLINQAVFAAYIADVRLHCMESRMRIIVGTLLVLFAAFCSFGFLASFEYPGIDMWKVGYAILALASLCSAYMLIRSGVQSSNQSD